jgi:hypothetical protein
MTAEYLRQCILTLAEKGRTADAVIIILAYEDVLKADVQ